MSEQAQTQTSGTPKPEIKGKVIAILPEWRNNTDTFWKREIVVETGFRYSNPLKVSFQKEATSHLDGINEGEYVVIPYVLNGREYEGRYYVDVVGMDLKKFNAGGAAKPAAAKPILGCTAATAIETWAKYHGDDKPGFAEFCKKQKPGKASKEYSITDWADIVNAIEAAEAAKNAAPAAETGATEDDDLSF